MKYIFFFTEAVRFAKSWMINLSYDMAAYKFLYKKFCRDFRNKNKENFYEVDKWIKRNVSDRMVDEFKIRRG